MAGAREYIRFTAETTPGTYLSTGAVTILDIEGPNAYTLRPTPLRQTIRTAGAFNRRRQTISRKTQYTGSLSFTARGTHASFLATALTFTGTPAVIPSYTVDHVIVGEDSGSTAIYSRILGVYVQQAQLSASSQDQWLKVQLQLAGLNQATITVTDFAEPALSAYPTDAFLTFEDGSGGLTLHSATRLDIESFQITVSNILDTRWFVASTPQKIKWCGRDVNWTSQVSLSSSIPRTDYEAQTPIGAGITFNNGTHTLVLGMEAANYYASVVDNLDISKVFLQELSLESNLDTTATSDFTITAT